nr:four helix bundle protein [Flavobacterium sp. ASV13]
MKPHKKLNSWIKSFEFVKEIYLVTNQFPSDEKFGITSQIRRASVSVPVNIAEGAARKGLKEFIHFLHISLGSLSELDTLILLSKELNFITEKNCEQLIEKLDIIGKLIYGLIKNLENRLVNQ